MDTPISNCLASHPSLLPLHMVSDIALALAFLAIAGAISLYMHQKQPDFKNTGFAVAGFMAWMGVVSILEVVNYIYPIHFILGGAKAITSLALVIFAISLFPLLPTLVQMITPHEYETMLRETMQQNAKLKATVVQMDTSLKDMEAALTNRVRHILATVHGFAKETARSSHDIQSYLKKFNARVAALSSTNNLLLANQWKGAQMKQVIYSQLELYASQGLDRVQVTGPDVYLRPEAVEHLSMAFHELVANSADHHLRDGQQPPTVISWMQHRDERSQSNDTLRLSWMEPIDGLASPPSDHHTGFGHVMLNYVVPTALDGLSELRFQDQGVVWELEAPVTSLCATT